MGAKLSPQNVQTINNVTELNFEDVDNVTYQMLIDGRTASLGMAFGYPRHKDGALVYILPSIPMGLVVDPSSTAIKEYTEEEYINNVLPTLDPLPEIEL